MMDRKMMSKLVSDTVFSDGSWSKLSWIQREREFHVSPFGLTVNSVKNNFHYFSWFWVKNWQIFGWFQVKSLKLSELGENGISKFRTEVKHDSLNVKHVNSLTHHWNYSWIAYSAGNLVLPLLDFIENKKELQKVKLPWIWGHYPFEYRISPFEKNSLHENWHSLQFAVK